MWFVAVPACVEERLGPWTSLRRSRDLTKGHRWKLCGPALLPVIPSLGIWFLLAGNNKPEIAKFSVVYRNKGYCEPFSILDFHERSALWTGIELKETGSKSRAKSKKSGAV